MSDYKKIGILTRNFDNYYGWGDFDILFENGTRLGKLECGREFEVLLDNGRWERTCLKWSDDYEQYYLEGIGYVYALGMTVRI